MHLNKLVSMLASYPVLVQNKNERRKYRVIACTLDKKGKVLSTRTNNYQSTHPLQKHFAVLVGKPDSVFLHAEIAALIAAKKEVHTILIARVDSKGDPVPAKPCKICQKAIEAYGVVNIIHT